MLKKTFLVSLAACLLLPLLALAQTPRDATSAGAASDATAARTNLDATGYYSPSGYKYIPDRRQDQYAVGNFGYFFVPLYIVIPGSGGTFALIGLFNNIGGTQIDSYLAVITGEKFQGRAFSLANVPVFSQYLTADFGVFNAPKIENKIYNGRGMDSQSDKYFYFKAKDLLVGAGRLTLSFWEKRLQFYQAFYGGSIMVDSLKDKKGNELIRTKRQKLSRDSQISGVNFDFTDDQNNPLKGMDLGLTYQNNQEGNKDSARYNTYDINLTFYVPVLEKSTWVFNAYASFNDVYHQGVTDIEQLRKDYSLTCPANAPPDCKQTTETYLEDLQADNRYGTAVSLGGLSRLRAYDTGRFRGANSQFVGTEFRWNFLRDAQLSITSSPKTYARTCSLPLSWNMVVWPIRKATCGKNMPSSYGTGLRITTASGLIYRFDLAWGDKGAFNVTAFIDYPWSNTRL